MTPLFLRLANSAVRLWTRAYTWRLPSALRAARREEIESDLWESQHDPAPEGRLSLPVRVFARMLLGIPDDLGWRVEQVISMNGSLWVRIALPVGVVGLLSLWLVSASTLTQPPPVPDPPRLPMRAASVPPPAPPPPPPFGSSAADAPAPVYGQASYRVHGNIKPPRKIKDARPVYPPIAIAGGVHGGVVVEATIDADGRISDARVVQSIPLFDHSAINAVRQWEFEPTKINGAPVHVAITVAVNFTRP